MSAKKDQASRTAGQTAGQTMDAAEDAAPGTELKPGDAAPDFDLPADSGQRVRLADYRGRALVLYFYPKDDTSGCTRQAQEFSAALADFRAAGADILGISRDNPARHDKFRTKHDLAVTLASDEDAAIARSYGVWKEKTLYGRKYMGVDRSSFLIDAQGRIVRIWRSVRVPGHVAQVLDAVAELDRVRREEPDIDDRP